MSQKWLTSLNRITWLSSTNSADVSDSWTCPECRQICPQRPLWVNSFFNNPWKSVHVKDSSSVTDLTGYKLVSVVIRPVQFLLFISCIQWTVIAFSIVTNCWPSIVVRKIVSVWKRLYVQHEVLVARKGCCPENVLLNAFVVKALPYIFYPHYPNSYLITGDPVNIFSLWS